MSSSEVLYVRASYVLLKLANIYTLLELLKMILHELVTIGLSSCEFSARDYSHRLAFMTARHPTKAISFHRWPFFLVKAL